MHPVFKLVMLIFRHNLTSVRFERYYSKFFHVLTMQVMTMQGGR